MTPTAFKHWRKRLDLSQKEAAEALGLKRRVVQYYEKGERDGEKVTIPKAVRLACWALLQGVTDYQGPASVEGVAVVGDRTVKGAVKDAPKEAKKTKPKTPDLGGAVAEEDDSDQTNLDEEGDMPPSKLTESQDSPSNKPLD